jgi:soluble lytic murein transglycosylase
MYQGEIMKNSAYLLIGAYIAFQSPLSNSVTPEITGETDGDVAVQSTARLEQARELMGTSYDSSVVGRAEKSRSLGRFVFEQTQERLAPRYKSQAHLIATTIIQEANRYQMDPIFLMAVISHESVFRPDIVGSAGEIGLMQIKPATAQWIAKRGHLHFTKASSLFNPAVNIRMGAAYLQYLRRHYKHNSPMYLNAYNLGPAALRASLVQSTVPHAYAGKVMKQYISLYEKSEIFVAASSSGGMISSINWKLATLN